jgi:hypothetical protein
MLTTNAALLLFLMQASGSPVESLNLAVPAPPSAPIQGGSTKGCNAAFDDHTPKPWDFCYPFPLRVTIVAHKPGQGYTNPSLVVWVTNAGKDAVTLPVGTRWLPAGGKETYLSFAVSLENVAGLIGSADAYADTNVADSLATIRPGQSIEYDLPINFDILKKMISLPHSAKTDITVRVKLGFHRLEKRPDGGLTSLTDTNEIPSGAFRIPYPD